MKKEHCIGIAGLLLVLNSFGQEKKGFDISGKLDGVDDNMPVYLLAGPDKELGEVQVMDTLKRSVIKNGMFSFSGSVPSGPRFYSVSVQGNIYPLRILLNNGDKVEVTAGKKGKWPWNAIITGAVYNDMRRDFENQLSQLAQDPYKTEKDQLAWIKDYVGRNLNSSYTPYIIGYLPIGDRKGLYDKLSPQIKSSYYGKLLNENIKKDAGLVSLVANRGSVKKGDGLLDFSSNTPGGKSVSIKSLVLKNKITLVDFWASWCGPCREEIPNLKKVYNKFKDKGFDIISISLDNSRQAWEGALKKENMPWQQFSQLKGSKEEMAVKLYSINGIPSCMLVNEKGEIIAMDMISPFAEKRDILRGAALHYEIDKYFNPHGGFTVSGQLEGLENLTSVYLTEGPDDEQEDVFGDTVHQVNVVNGKFVLPAQMNVGPRFYTLHIGALTPLKILINKGEQITITGTANGWPDSIRINGALYNEERLALEKESLSHRKEGAKAMFEWLKNYIIEHRSSGYTPYLVSFLMTYSERQESYDKLTTSARESYYGKILKERLKSDSLTTAMRGGKENLQIGDNMLDFISNTTDGTSVTLKALVAKNKLTLIDFWASWCGPCIKEIPVIKKAYADFKSKGFNVISVSLDKDKKAWEGAIDKLQLPWVHLSQLKGFDELGAKVYGISGIPSCLLVDEHGKVVAMSLNSNFGRGVTKSNENLSGELLYQRISTFFGGK